MDRRTSVQEPRVGPDERMNGKAGRAARAVFRRGALGGVGGAQGGWTGGGGVRETCGRASVRGGVGGPAAHPHCRGVCVDRYATSGLVRR